MKKNKNYKHSEKKAYYIGVGAGVGFGRGKTIQSLMKNMSPRERESFKNGFDSALNRKPWKK